MLRFARCAHCQNLTNHTHLQDPGGDFPDFQDLGEEHPFRRPRLKSSKNRNLLPVRLKSESGLSYQHGLEVSPVSPVFLIFLVSLEPTFQTSI